MTNPYLLIAGYTYYPSSGTGNWIDCYETEEVARENWEKISDRYDWHKIVDLRDWMNRFYQGD